MLDRKFIRKIKKSHQVLQKARLSQSDCVTLYLAETSPATKLYKKNHLRKGLQWVMTVKMLLGMAQFDRPYITWIIAHHVASVPPVP